MYISYTIHTPFHYEDRQNFALAGNSALSSSEKVDDNMYISYRQNAQEISLLLFVSRSLWERTQLPPV